MKYKGVSQRDKMGQEKEDKGVTFGDDSRQSLANLEFLQ